MAEELAELLGVKVKLAADTIKYLAALIAVMVLLLFFALSPMHALILCGFLVILATLYFKPDHDIQKTAFLVGSALIFLGFAAIFVPSVAHGLISTARGLRQLMLGG